jgi:hypothetical protein
MKSRFASSAPSDCPSALVLAKFAPHNGTGLSTGGLIRQMPTLFRFLVTLGILAGLVYGAMFALVTFVEPKKGEMTVRIPPEKINPKQ